MSDERNHEQARAHRQAPEDRWREVGQQFEALGESLSNAFRAAWESEDTQKHVRSMRVGLERMVQKVDSALKEAQDSEEGQRLRAEAERTAESLREAGEKTWQEARPQLVTALTTFNTELERLIRNLEEESAPEGQEGSSEPKDSSSREPAGRPEG